MNVFEYGVSVGLVAVLPIEIEIGNLLFVCLFTRACPRKEIGKRVHKHPL